MLFLKALQEEQFSITVHAGQAYRLQVAGGLEACDVEERRELSGKSSESRALGWG